MTVCVEGDAALAEQTVRRQFAGGGEWAADVRTKPAGELVFIFVRLAGVFDHEVVVQVDALRGVLGALPHVSAQVFSTAGRRETPNIS